MDVVLVACLVELARRELTTGPPPQAGLLSIRSLRIEEDGLSSPEGVILRMLWSSMEGSVPNGGRQARRAGRGGVPSPVEAGREGDLNGLLGGLEPARTSVRFEKRFGAAVPEQWHRAGSRTSHIDRQWACWAAFRMRTAWLRCVGRLAHARLDTRPSSPRARCQALRSVPWQVASSQKR